MNKYFEALKRLAMPYDLHISECKKLGIGLTEDYEVMEKALQQYEKEHRALEIIKKKYPNDVETMLCKDYEQYKLRKSSQCYTVKIDWNDKPLLDYLLLLTKEEFNLLKEVLE